MNIERSQATAMPSSSDNNMDMTITNSTNHVDMEMLCDDIKGKIVSSNQANKSKKVLNSKAKAGATKTKIDMGNIDLTKAPSLCSQISPSSMGRPQETKPQKVEEDGAIKNVAAPEWQQGYQSPTLQAQGTFDDDVSSGVIATPTSNLSPEKLTLAQLYHSSRRSRHSPQTRSGYIPPPPLTFSSSIDSSQQVIGREMENVISSTDKKDWSFDIASCSSDSSIGSMESCEELMTCEDIMASEFFDEDNAERESKRRRTAT